MTHVAAAHDDHNAAPERQRIIVFGGGGAIGQAIVEKFVAEDWFVIASGRGPAAATLKAGTWLEFDPLGKEGDDDVLGSLAPVSAVCWAQGANLNDSIYDVDAEKNLSLYRANCLFVIVTLQKLLQRKLLKPASRLCIISSVWQNLARQNKLSYSVTKAALQGLVLSCAADLAAEGHLINAVLPGALETPMTRANLTTQQIERFTSATKFNRLSTLTDVVNLVFYLCSPYNTGVTGQFIGADLGFSHVRLI